MLATVSADDEVTKTCADFFRIFLFFVSTLFFILTDWGLWGETEEKIKDLDIGFDYYFRVVQLTWSNLIHWAENLYLS